MNDGAPYSVCAIVSYLTRLFKKKIKKFWCIVIDSSPVRKDFQCQAECKEHASFGSLNS